MGKGTHTPSVCDRPGLKPPFDFDCRWQGNAFSFASEPSLRCRDVKCGCEIPRHSMWQMYSLIKNG